SKSVFNQLLYLLHCTFNCIRCPLPCVPYLITSHFDSGSLLEEEDQARACLRKFTIKVINFRANILGKIESMLLKILGELIRRIPKMPDMFIFCLNIYTLVVSNKSRRSSVK